MDFRKDSILLMAQLLPKDGTEVSMTIEAGGPFQYFTTRKETASLLRRRRLGPCSIRVIWGWTKKEIKWAQVRMSSAWRRLRSNEKRTTRSGGLSLALLQGDIDTRSIPFN